MEAQQGGQLQCDLGQGWAWGRGHALKITAEKRAQGSRQYPFPQCVRDQLLRPEVPHELVLVLSRPQRRKRSSSWNIPLGAPFPLLVCPPSPCPQKQTLRAFAFKGRETEGGPAAVPPGFSQSPASLFTCCSLPTSLSRDMRPAAYMQAHPGLSQAEKPLLMAPSSSSPICC